MSPIRLFSAGGHCAPRQGHGCAQCDPGPLDTPRRSFLRLKLQVHDVPDLLRHHVELDQVQLLHVLAIVRGWFLKVEQQRLQATVVRQVDARDGRPISPATWCIFVCVFISLHFTHPLETPNARCNAQQTHRTHTLRFMALCERLWLPAAPPSKVPKVTRRRSGRGLAAKVPSQHECPEIFQSSKPPRSSLEKAQKNCHLPVA